SVDNVAAGRQECSRRAAGAVVQSEGGPMIYMVEMDFPHPERLREWHDWYLAHVRVLQTVPGFRASQRFQAMLPAAAPYLALHEVSGPEMFESAAYRSRGGRASPGAKAGKNMGRIRHGEIPDHRLLHGGGNEGPAEGQSLGAAQCLTSGLRQ